MNQKQHECRLCPRNCGLPRPGGRCGMPEKAVIARAALHAWEEPCISGEHGSGTVFFAGCPLGCVYCQNREISRSSARTDPRFRTADSEELRRICLSLVDMGAHNINFITPSHYVSLIAQTVGDGFGVPVVYNCGGYESPEAIRLLKDKVQIYLPDFKYALAEPAQRYSHAPDYPEIAKTAICRMVEQVGAVRLGDDGMMRSGVLIRHLVLPGQVENSLRVLDWIDRTFAPGEVLFSLMAQFTPIPSLETAYPELNRTVTEDEYETIVEALEETDIEGFLQEPSSATEDYLPAWGVFPPESGKPLEI